MPTEQLKQALRETNVAGVEKDFAEVLARMFDLPVQAVARLVYAIETVKHPVTWHLGHARTVELIPDPELRDAIRARANAGAARVYLRKLQLEGRQVSVPTLAMIPPAAPGRICEGCPHSMSCIAESLSSPEQCVDILSGPAKGWVDKKQPVTLIRVTPSGRVTVRARQPLGDHDVPADIVEY
jgi:hypothetical protein